MMQATHQTTTQCKTYVAAIAACALLSCSNPAGAEEISFPKEGWDPALIAKIEAGPAILSKDFDTGVALPPENDSEVTKSELATLRSYKAQRTSEQVEDIQLEHTENVLSVFEKVGNFKLYNNLKTVGLFQLLSRDIEYFILRDKMAFSRARPTQLADNLDPVVDVPKHAAYPSGHAAQSYFMALLFSELDPAKEELYKNQARDIAHRREIAGLHYPSDTQAGMVLAQNVFNAVMQDENIQTLLKQAKTEF